MNDAPLWFYESRGERLGPVSATEIGRLRREGVVQAGTLVWREGLEGWEPLSATELAAAVVPPPPPVLSPGPPPVPRRFEPFVPREARLRPGFRPSIRRSHGLALEALKDRFWPLVGCFTLTSLMLGVASQLSFPLLFIVFPLMGGLYWYILTHLRGKEPNLEMLFLGFRRQFGPLAILNLLVVGISMLVVLVLIALIAAGSIGVVEADLERELERNPALLIGAIVATLVGVLVFLIPLMIFGITANFAILLLLDCEIPVKRALSLGWQASKAHLPKLVLFMFVNALLSFVGILALFVGLYVTSTWATIALVCLYEDAFGDEPRDLA